MEVCQRGLETRPIKQSTLSLHCTDQHTLLIALLAELEKLKSSSQPQQQHNGHNIPKTKDEEDIKNIKLKDSQPPSGEHNPLYGPPPPNGNGDSNGEGANVPDVAQPTPIMAPVPEDPANSDADKDGVAQKQKPASETNNDDDDEEYDKVFYRPYIPSSSIWCHGSSLFDRVCRFKNICYHAEANKYFVVKTSYSIFAGVPSDYRVAGLVEPSSVHDHNLFRLYLDEVSPSNPIIRNKPVRYIKSLTFMHQRFQPANIMHVFHDDIFGLFHLIRETLGPNSLNGLTKTYATRANLSHPSHNSDPKRQQQQKYRIFFMDPHYRYESVARPADYLAPLPFKKTVDIAIDPQVITCFENAVMGTPKLGMFYQYGLYSPQGPMLDHKPKGLHLREVAAYFIEQMGLEKTEDEMEGFGISHKDDEEGSSKDQKKPLFYGFEEYAELMKRRRLLAPLPKTKEMEIQEKLDKGEGDRNSILGITAETLELMKKDQELEASLPPADERFDRPDSDLIIILSRRQNRLILNEDELAKHLTSTFKLQTVFLRMEDQNFDEQIALMRRARIVLGMHGSILVLGAFCKRGTVLIEMFPYGVRSGDFSPYKTMSELPGMELVYRAWEVSNSNTLNHCSLLILIG
jgi:hypothetical protein